MQSIKSTENQLKKIIKLPIKLQKDAENLLNLYTGEKTFINKIKEISKSFGLNFDIKFDVIIVSAEKKYLFNYLSGAFGNKNPEKGAEKLSEFIYDKRFKNVIQHLSARAIYDQDVVDKVLKSLDELNKLGYPTNKGSFYFEMKSLYNEMIKKLKTDKGIVLIGIPPSTKILDHFDRLLAHEIFHLVLMSNGIWFQGIKEEYDNLDEGLAIFLERRYTKNRNQIATLFWEDKLIPLKKDTRIKSIKKLYNNLKKGKAGPKFSNP